MKHLDIDKYLHHVENPDAIELLLKAGADVDAKNNHGFTLLMSARDEKIVKVLLDHNADVDIDAFGYTALRLTQNIEIAKMLLKHGADMDIQDDMGNTVLHNAILRNDIELIKLLLDNDVDVDIENYDDMTPLMFANSINYKHIVAMLEEHIARFKSVK